MGQAYWEINSLHNHKRWSHGKIYMRIFSIILPILQEVERALLATWDMCDKVRQRAYATCAWMVHQNWLLVLARDTVWLHVVKIVQTPYYLYISRVSALLSLYKPSYRLLATNAELSQGLPPHLYCAVVCGLLCPACWRALANERAGFRNLRLQRLAPEEYGSKVFKKRFTWLLVGFPYNITT